MAISDYKEILIQNQYNMFQWYPFEEQSSILEICLNDEDEGVKINQFTKIVREIREIKENESYDYLIIIGDLKKIDNAFDRLINLTNETGKILIITDNQLSVKSMCQNKNTEQLYNRKEIDEKLDKLGLINRKYYYMFPDYKNANVIFTDKHKPNIDTISRNITFFSEDVVVTFPENEKLKEIIEQDDSLVRIFANSFFIECSKKEFKDNNIEFVSYSNMRKERYKIQTIIKDEKVYKTNVNEKAREHIENVKRNIDILKENHIATLDSYNGDTIISEYQRENKPVDALLIDKLLNNQKQKAIDFIKIFYENLKEKLQLTNYEKNVFEKYDIQYNEKEIANLHFVKHGLWDLTFQNSFYINNTFYFYDQEWYEENVPVEFIMYRANLYCKQLQNYIEENVFYEITGIKEENIRIFRELDNILQLNIRNAKAWKIHTSINTIEKIKNQMEQLKTEKEQFTEDCMKLLNEKDARIKFLEDNMKSTCELLKQKEMVIDQMENSMSWKITKPLRYIRGARKEQKNEN